MSNRSLNTRSVSKSLGPRKVEDQKRRGIKESRNGESTSNLFLLLLVRAYPSNFHYRPSTHVVRTGIHTETDLESVGRCELTFPRSLNLRFPSCVTIRLATDSVETQTSCPPTSRTPEIRIFYLELLSQDRRDPLFVHYFPSPSRDPLSTGHRCEEPLFFYLLR